MVSFFYTKAADILLDLEVIKEMVRYIRQLSQTEPFQNTVSTCRSIVQSLPIANAIFPVKEVVPGPSCTSSEDMKHFIGENIGTAFRESCKGDLFLNN